MRIIFTTYAGYQRSQQIIFSSGAGLFGEFGTYVITGYD